MKIYKNIPQNAAQDTKEYYNYIPVGEFNVYSTNPKEVKNILTMAGIGSDALTKDILVCIDNTCEEKIRATIFYARTDGKYYYYQAYLEGFIYSQANAVYAYIKSNIERNGVD